MGCSRAAEFSRRLLRVAGLSPKTLPMCRITYPSLPFHGRGRYELLTGGAVKAQ
jgi:hypothetical protein